MRGRIAGTGLHAKGSDRAEVGVSAKLGLGSRDHGDRDLRENRGGPGGGGRRATTCQPTYETVTLFDLAFLQTVFPTFFFFTVAW